MNKKILVILTMFVMSCSVYCSNAAFATSQQLQDKHFMHLAIKSAKTSPRAPFAALIVDQKTGEIMGQGINSSRANPTLHGEIAAINDAAAKHPDLDWHRMTLYTTAEPCPMCQSAIVWAGIPRVVYATSIDYLNQHGWAQIMISSADVNRHAAFYKGVIVGGVLAEETDPMFHRQGMRHDRHVVA